jgi:hypothetical protein
MGEGSMKAKSAALAKASEALGDEGSMAVSKYGKDKQGIVASSSSSKSPPNTRPQGGGRGVQEEHADPVDAASTLLQAVMRQHQRLQTGYGSKLQAGVGESGRNVGEGAGVEEVFWGERGEEAGGGGGALVLGQSKAGRDVRGPGDGREQPNEVCFTCVRCGELFENSSDDQQEDVCCKVCALDFHSDTHICGHSLCT